MASLLAFIRRILKTSFLGVLIPLSLFILFSVLLAFVLVLYKPLSGPTRVQRVGWQEWDLVSLSNTGKVQQPVSPPQSNPDKGSNPNDDFVDWWDVEEEDQSAQSSSSLPLDGWNPLLPHDTGLSEIAITRCFMDPGYGFCFPKTTPEEDSHKGKWTLVEQDLDQKDGMYFLNIYYRRTRRLDIPLITDLRIIEGDDISSLPDPKDEWRGVPTSIRDGVPGQKPAHLWYRLGPSRSQMSDTDATQLVTELMIKNGEGRPWYGFEALSPAVNAGKQGKTESVYLTYRRGVKLPPKAKPLHFTHNGQFKILQIADLHFSVSRGECRDTEQPCHDSDDQTLALMARTLDLEKPDLVVFTGDQLNGQGTSWDPRAVLSKFITPVIDRKIPWAAVLGNHDDEDAGALGMDRKALVKWMSAMPYSLVDVGPSDLHGAGNYVLKVYSADASKTQLLTLYFLDSGAYSAGLWSMFGFFPTEYDWIHEEQVQWFLGESSKIKHIKRPFTPDGAKDLAGLWGRRRETALRFRRQEAEESALKKPNAMMFYHIPIKETYSTPDIDPKSGKPLNIGEQLEEGQGTPNTNGGLFDNGLMKAYEDDDNHGREVKVVANGHCHLNENCRRVQGTWFCFDGGSSYSGYGKKGFDRRMRVFYVEDYGEKITTWKRTESQERIDELVLVGKGGPEPYGS